MDVYLQKRANVPNATMNPKYTSETERCLKYRPPLAFKLDIGDINPGFNVITMNLPLALILVRQQLAAAALKESYKDIAKASRLFNMRDVTAVLDDYKLALRNFLILSGVL
jgi:hypothetical protein